MRKVVFDFSFFCHRDNKTINAPIGQGFHGLHFFLIGFVGNTGNNLIAIQIGCFFNAFKNLGEEIIQHVGNHDANCFGSPVFQTQSIEVGLVFFLLGVFFYFLFGFVTDLITIVQGFGNR